MATLQSLCFLLVCPCLRAVFVLDVGAPRTGTQSMYTAFKMMGLRPIHSFYELSVREPLCTYLFGDPKNRGSLDDALATLKGYDAAMDEPFMLLYEEILATIPDAKFLLTITDPEDWYQNYQRLTALEAKAGLPSANERPPYFANCTAMRSWGCRFAKPNVESQKEMCLQNYARHIERVQQVIPSEQLLVYNWSDGWAPLAHFVGVPVPPGAFPHVDDAKMLVEMLVH